MLKAYLFGDSIARGVIYDEERLKYAFLSDGFPSTIEQTLDIKVENCARFGATIAKTQELIDRNKSKFNKGDIAILEVGGNDCDYDWERVAEFPDTIHVPKTPIAAFRQAYVDMIASLQSCGLKVIIMNLPPLEPDRFFEWISQGKDKKAILQFLGGSTLSTYRWQEMYSVCVQDIALACNVPCIDIRSAFLRLSNYSDYICKDGIHPNEKGHRLISDAIEQELPQLVYRPLTLSPQSTHGRKLLKTPKRICLFRLQNPSKA